MGKVLKLLAWVVAVMAFFGVLASVGTEPGWHDVVVLGAFVLAPLIYGFAIIVEAAEWYIERTGRKD